MVRKVVRGFGLNMFGGVANAVLSFGFVVVLTHALSVANFGVFFQVVAIFSTLIVVCQLGAGATIVKTIPEYRAVGRIHDLRRGIAVALLPGAIFSVAIAAGLFILAPYLGPELVKDGGSEADATTYLRVLAPFIPLAALMAVLLAATRGLGTMRLTVILDNIFKPGFRFLLACVALAVALPAATFATLWGLPLALGFVVAVFAILRMTGATVHPKRQDVMPPTASRHLLREFWAFTAPQWPADVFQLAVLWIDVVLVGALVSSSAAGIYAAVSRLVTVGALGLVALVLVLGPVLSSLLAQREFGRVRELYRLVTVWLSLGSVPIFLVMATFAPLLVEVFGSGYESGAPILSILSLALMVDVVAGPALLTLLMGGRSFLVLANTAAGFVANIGLNLLLIPPFEMTGAAIAWTVSILIVNVLAVVQIRRIWGILGFDWTFVMVATTAGLCYGVGGLACGAVWGQTLPALLAALSIGTVLYFAILWPFRARLELGSLATAIRPSSA